jgi:hypothetical protein
MRREGGRSEDRRPRGVSKAKVESVTKQYIKQLDGMFSEKKGSAEAQKLEAAMRAAHGTPGLAAACREYLEGVGPPTEAALIGMFLDSGAPELVVAGLSALQAVIESGEVKLSGGLRSQVRMLAEDPDNEIAELAEELAERL